MGKPGPVDAIASAIANRRSPRRWFHRVSAEHAKTLEAIRKAWLEGRFGKQRRTASREIAAYLASAGIANVGVQGVEEWLEKP